ncbi:MAG: hypothetical protein ABW172_03425, partial [Candidatus Binatia bacterium]
ERWLLAGGFGGGVVCVALQLVNCVWLGVAWPHLATITWYLALSFIVFVRLVQPEARPLRPRVYSNGPRSGTR